MKILHVTRQFLPSTGGIQQAVYQLVRHQRMAGTVAHVLTLNRVFHQPNEPLPANEVIDGIQVYRVPYWGSKRYAFAPGILRFARGYDLLHIHSSDFFLDYLAATRGLHQTPMVLTSHGLFFHSDFARRAKELYFRTITRIGLRGMEAVICVSDHDCQMLLNIVPKEKLHQIANGIDYERLAQTAGSIRNPNLLCAIGGLTERKRYDRMLEVFAAVTRCRPEARLVIIGANLGLHVMLKEQALALGIHEQVTFAGEISDEEVVDYLHKSSVFLASPAYEAFGIAAVEAAVAGCTPVIQPIPAYCEHFGAVDNTIFADYDNVEHAAAQVCRALELTAAEKQRLTDEYRARFRAYSWSAVTRQTMQLYSRVTAR